MRQKATLTIAYFCFVLVRIIQTIFCSRFGCIRRTLDHFHQGITCFTHIHAVTTFNKLLLLEMPIEYQKTNGFCQPFLCGNMV